MATITEVTDSGVGSYQSVDDGEANRLFTVQGSAETEDWVGHVIAAFPRGSRHNKPTFQNYLAYSHHEVQWVNCTSRIVQVVYRPQNDPAFDEWVTEVEFSAEMADIYEDVPAVPGPGVPDVETRPRRIEVPAYRARPVNPGEALTGFWTTGANGAPLVLEQTGAWKPLPQNVLRGTMTFTMSKRVELMSWKKIIGAGRARTCINSTKFIEFPARTVLLANFGLTESFGPRLRGGVGFLYDVRFQFIYNPAEWSPMVKYHSWQPPEVEGQAEGGPEYPIHWAGTGIPFGADFVNANTEVGIRRRIFQETDFYSVLSSIGAGAPPVIA